MSRPLSNGKSQSTKSFLVIVSHRLAILTFPGGGGGGGGVDTMLHKHPVAGCLVNTGTQLLPAESEEEEVAMPMKVKSGF